jgi:hypothetical protein
MATICLWLYGPVNIGHILSFLIYTQSVGLLGWEITSLQGRYLHTEQHKQNKSTKISMPRGVLKPMIPVFEQAKTIHVLDHTATVINRCMATIP